MTEAEKEARATEREELIDKLVRVYAAGDYWQLEAEYPTKTREDAEQGIEYARYVVTPLADAVLAEYVKCDHGSRCCRVHGTHTMPHRGCTLR